MNRGAIFSVLEIDETKDKELIKAAYMKKLAYTNPEDNPEGFKRLREAYDEALRLADESEDTSPVGLWMKAVKEAYGDFDARLDKWTWEELFEDEVCTDAGTYVDAREALLVFLMDNTYIPNFVFDMIFDIFKIREDYDELAEKFPTGFLDFLLRYGNGIKVELIKAESGKDVDNACNMWFEYRNAVGEGNQEKKTELEKAYEALNVKMPYFTVDMAVEAAEQGQNDRAAALLNEVEYIIGEDGYISAACANANMLLGNVDRAMEICDIVEEKFPANILVKILRADAVELSGDYATAKKMYEDIYGKTNNQAVFDKLQAVNKKIIESLKADTAADKIELGWCYYQNEQNDKLMELMDSFEPEEEKDFAMYYNLRSRALLNAERYSEAEKCIDRWRSELDKQVTENDKEENDRRRRIVLSAFFAARCLRIMADKNNDDELRRKALLKTNETTVCEETEVVLQLWLEKVTILKELKNFEDAINWCENIIEKDVNCFPAYVLRQECNFELRRAGAVLDDYHNILNIIPDLEYAMPYALAAHVFVIYDRYDNALEIIKRAEDNNAKSDYLSYVKASALRYKASGEEDTKIALDILLAIADKEEKDRIDFNCKRTLDLFEELCFAYMDLKQWKDAVKAIDTAIALEPDNVERCRIKLDIYKQSEDTKGFNKCISEIKKQFGEVAFVFYEQAKMLEKSNRAKAISLYKRVLEKEEGYKDTNSRLRELYQREYFDKYDENSFNSALEYANKSIELYPYAQQYMERGIVYMAKNLAAEAERDFRKAVELDDEFIMAMEWLGDALRVQEKHESALKYYSEAYRLAKGNGNYYPANDYAIGCEAAMDYDKALEVLLEMTRDFPEEKFVWSALGGLYGKMGQHEKAYEAYMYYRNNNELSIERLINNDRDLLEVAWSLGNKNKEIFTLISDTLKKYPNEPKAEMNMALYYCYLVGDKKLAYKFADKAVKLAKDSEACRYCTRKRVEIIAMFNDSKKMKFHDLIYIGKSVTFDKKAPYRDKRYQKMELYTLGLYYYFIGDKQTAYSMFGDMQSGNNCSTCRYNVCVEALVGKALMLADKGEYDEAVKCLERVLEENFDPYMINKIIDRIKEKM